MIISLSGSHFMISFCRFVSPDCDAISQENDGRLEPSEEGFTGP